VCVDKRPDPVGEPSKDRVRERNGSFEPGAADELDGLVHRRIAGDAVHIAELVRTESQRGPYRRVETRDTPPAEVFDRAVECPDALNGSECKPLRERAVTRVEPVSGTSQDSVGIGPLLEDTEQDLECRRARGPYRLRPRSHAS
jgi:hypothetical protein